MNPSTRNQLAAMLRTAQSRVTVTIGSAHAIARHRWFSGPVPTRALLISDGRNYTSEQQFAPLFRHAAVLRRCFGINFEPVTVDRALRGPAAYLAAADLVFLKLAFQTPADEAVGTVRQLVNRLEGSMTRLAYFDGDDDLCIQWPDVIPLVDLYVKKHVFADLSQYGRSYVGKSNLTDKVSRDTLFSFSDNQIPATRPVPTEYLDKLHLGWNIGFDEKIAKLALTPLPLPRCKDIDIACRAFVPHSTWIHALRAPLTDHISALSGRYRVLAPSERVSQQQYYDEMRRARICVSPFGYGEICWRDFEAVLCGCLLVKPDMSHLRTSPDIFIPGETYVPVKWDYSNLEAVCRPYLEDEVLRNRVASAAREKLLQELREDAFVEVFASLLRNLGISFGPGKFN